MSLNKISERKKLIEKRLTNHGITDVITYIPYLRFDESKFAAPFESGCRMMILYSLSYTSLNIEDKESIMRWLKHENIWDHVSPKEKKFFEDGAVDERQIIDLSWQSESAYILAWALNIIEDSPSPTEPVSQSELDIFMESVPQLGEPLNNFLSKLSYREASEIHDENLFHELATSYFRDLIFSNKPDETDIDRKVSFIRHQTLNWLRRFMDITEWDNTETST